MKRICLTSILSARYSVIGILAIMACMSSLSSSGHGLPGHASGWGNRTIPAMSRYVPSIPALVVSGTVRDRDGNSAGAGLAAQVTNDDRQLTSTGTTDEAGRYVVTLASLDPQKGLIAAAVGETISVKVMDSAGKLLGTGSKKLEAEHIQAAHVSIPIEIGPTPKIILTSVYREWESGILEIEAEDPGRSLMEVLFQYSLDNETWYDIYRDAEPPYLTKWDTRPAIPTVDDSVWVKAVAIYDGELTAEDTKKLGIDNELPGFSNWSQEPENLTKFHQGAFRIKVKVTDAGGSGIFGDVLFDYHIGDSTSYDGYEAMTADANSVWHFDVISDWSSHAGKSLYYRVQASDIAGNTATSMEQTELIETSEADFMISTVKTEITANAGDLVTWPIVVEGKNGFESTVTLGLLGTNLLLGDEVTFSPERVTISIAEPIASSQLMLRISDKAVSGDYPFTVIARSDTGEIRDLELMLKIVYLPTTLTLVLQPVEKPLRFMGEVNVLGQLVALTDKPVKLDALTVYIRFTSPSESLYQFEVKTDSTGRYQLLKPFCPNEVGEWQIKVWFDGNQVLKPSKSEDSFTVAKGELRIIFDIPTDDELKNGILIGTELEIKGHLEPGLEGELLSLRIIWPDGSSFIIPDAIITEASGVFRYKLKLDKEYDWQISVIWGGNHRYESTEETLVIPVVKKFGKVILALGGGDRDDNPEWPRFRNVAEYVRRVFIRRSFSDEEDIYFLSPDPKATEGADNVTSTYALELAITDWAAKQVNEQIPLYVYLLSHNLGDKFLLEKRGNQETYLTPAQLDKWLDLLPQSTPVMIVIEACYSGGFIQTDEGEPTPLTGPKRAIIVSARGDRQAKILPNGSSFTRFFFDRVDANQTVGEAFQYAEGYMKRSRVHQDQLPQMDADGDGKYDEGKDYAQVKDWYIPIDMVSLAEPPTIVDVTPSQTLPEGATSLKVRAELIGVGITRVFATVIPPNFDPSQQIKDWSYLDFPELELTEVSSENNRHEYAATYDGFTIPGDYTIVFQAENPDGYAIPVQTTITVPEKVAVEKGDVNGDGKVGSNDAIITLRAAAGMFILDDDQKRVADMNNDGKVNSADAILILRKAAGLAAPRMETIASGNRAITITLDEVCGTAGGDTVILLRVDSVDELAGGEVYIGYDSSALNAVEIVSSSNVMMSSNTGIPGMIRISFASTDRLSSSIIASIHFRILNDNISQPILQAVEFYDHDAHPLEVRKVSGPFPAMVPETTSLLQNYPNPFNPETWIPFQLAEDSEVIIRIYNSTGQLIRVLNMGYKEAGLYVTKGMAAHWDGKNGIGEHVMSGIHFYSIEAGDYTAVRKMTVAQ